MRSRENLVNEKSEYFVYTPSKLAKDLFFYPLAIGHYFYEKDYFLYRNSYDSYLIMLIKDGSCVVVTNERTYTARKGDVVFLDCYQPHSYYTNEGFEALWVHFDGMQSQGYYKFLMEKSGNLIALKDELRFEDVFYQLYRPFQKKNTGREVEMSREITGLLTELALAAEKLDGDNGHSRIVERCTSYIRENIGRQISLAEMADHVKLSKYYFTRLFKKETGFTPYEYTILSRINHAKYLLNRTNAPTKEICFLCGFTSESAFCNTFKKWEKQTPGQFRKKTYNPY